MTEECKLFIGGLTPETEQRDLELWMSCLTAIQPDEIHMMEVKPGAPVRCAFAIYRRASE